MVKELTDQEFFLVEKHRIDKLKDMDHWYEITHSEDSLIFLDSERKKILKMTTEEYMKYSNIDLKEMIEGRTK